MRTRFFTGSYNWEYHVGEFWISISVVSLQLSRISINNSLSRPLPLQCLRCKQSHLYSGIPVPQILSLELSTISLLPVDSNTQPECSFPIYSKSHTWGQLMGGQPFDMLLDTGASKCYMSTEFYNKNSPTSQIA